MGKPELGCQSCSLRRRLCVVLCYSSVLGALLLPSRSGSHVFVCSATCPSPFGLEERGSNTNSSQEFK